jgi:hypothetical protein
LGYAGSVANSIGSLIEGSVFGLVDADRDRPHPHKVSRKLPHQGSRIRLFAKPAGVITRRQDDRHAVMDFANEFVASVVMIARVRIHSPDAGSFQILPDAAIPNGAPSLMAMDGHIHGRPCGPTASRKEMRPTTTPFV